MVVVQATDPSPAPHTVLVRGDGRTPPCSVCSQRTHVGAPGGPHVRQALERPAMLAHACRGPPIKAGARAGHETEGAAIRNTLWHVRVSAPIIDARVQLPALIRSRSCLERLLDHRTLPGCQVPSSLPLPRSIGALAWQPPRDSAAARPSRAGAARRLCVPHSWHRGVVVPCRYPPSRPLCDDVERYAAPWLLAVLYP